MNLSEDIPSLINPKRIYGRQGDSVGVISYHGSVAIVENIHGEKFPVLAALLTGKIVAKVVSPENDINTEKRPEPKTPVKKRVKVSSNDSIPNLF